MIANADRRGTYGGPAVRLGLALAMMVEALDDDRPELCPEFRGTRVYVPSRSTDRRPPRR